MSGRPGEPAVVEERLIGMRYRLLSPLIFFFVTLAACGGTRAADTTTTTVIGLPVSGYAHAGPT